MSSTQPPLFPANELPVNPTYEPGKKGNFRFKQMRKKKPGEGSVDRLVDILADKIFPPDKRKGEYYRQLDMQQYIFVLYQVRYFRRTYKPKIMNKVRPLLGGRYFNDTENELVLEWFYDRIPLYIIFRAVNECERINREKYEGECKINSLFYFKRRVQEEFTRRINQNDPFGYSEKEKIYFEQKNGLWQKADKWKYKQWKSCKDTHNFDPFSGEIIGTIYI